MIEITKTEVVGWEHAIRGMRNPMNSWERSDSEQMGYYMIGNNDLDLMKRLAAKGSVHAKYRRMIVVYTDILAPLYWWKEFDTYKVGTVANSGSTMHKIHAKEFVRDDFSCERLSERSRDVMDNIIYALNSNRKRFLETGDKDDWWQLIQLLPSSYNQLRTVMLNYEVLTNIYANRKNHKLDEWRDFCRWIEGLPLSELIINGKPTKEAETDMTNTTGTDE